MAAAERQLAHLGKRDHGGGQGCWAALGVAVYLLHVLNQDLSQRAEIPGTVGESLKRQGSKPMKILDTILEGFCIFVST